MLKVPDKKYVPKHNRELKDYAQGWNYCLKEIERLCDEYDDEYAKGSLLRRKEVALKKGKTPFYEGVYDCIIEIERLNEEPEHRLDNFFKDSLDALDKLNIRSEVSSCSKEEKNTKVVVDKERLIKLLDYLSKDCPFELMKDEEPIFTCSLDNCLSDEPHCWKEWLKVKELPKKLEENTDDEYDYEWLYKRGYNNCLKEISGETE